MNRNKLQYAQVGPFLLLMKEVRGKPRVLCPHCDKFVSMLISEGCVCEKCLKKLMKKKAKG